jgi:hypothetical protein
MINSNKIKEHFQSKTIQTSENSWNKLEDLLNKNEEKSSKKLYFLNYIAVACLLLVGIVVWNNDQDYLPGNKEQEVVNDNNLKLNFEIKNNEKINENKKPEVIDFKLNNNTINSRSEVNIAQKMIKKVSNNFETKEKLNQNIVEDKKDLEIKIIIPELNKKEVLITNKTNENTNETMLNREIVQSKITIDAELLLNAAEKDLDVEHRDKTIIKLKKGFIKIKTYVNNVNYE